MGGAHSQWAWKVYPHLLCTPSFYVNPTLGLFFLFVVIDSLAIINVPPQTFHGSMLFLRCSWRRRVHSQWPWKMYPPLSTYLPTSAFYLNEYYLIYNIHLQWTGGGSIYHRPPTVINGPRSIYHGAGPYFTVKNGRGVQVPRGSIHHGGPFTI